MIPSEGTLKHEVANFISARHGPFWLFSLKIIHSTFDKSCCVAVLKASLSITIHAWIAIYLDTSSEYNFTQFYSLGCVNIYK